MAGEKPSITISEEAHILEAYEKIRRNDIASDPNAFYADALMKGVLVKLGEQRGGITCVEDSNTGESSFLDKMQDVFLENNQGPEHDEYFAPKVVQFRQRPEQPQQ